MAHRLAGSYLQETTCELLNILFAYAFNDVSDWPQWALALATLYSLCYFYYPCLPGITNQSLLVAACNFVVLDRHPAALLLSAASQTTDLSMESRSWITCRQCTPPPNAEGFPRSPPPSLAEDLSIGQMLALLDLPFLVVGDPLVLSKADLWRVAAGHCQLAAICGESRRRTAAQLVAIALFHKRLFA